MKEVNQPGRIAILVNLSASGGRSRRSWARIEQKVLSQLPPDTLVLPFEKGDLTEEKIRQVREERQVNTFISAGGDGSVHCLLNHLMAQKKPECSPFYLGAVGLGSSNDFHKPFNSTFRGIPIRINTKTPRRADVGKVIVQSGSGIPPREAYFLVNASLGVTAWANNNFNNSQGLIRFLKKHWTSLTILLVAIQTIATYRNFRATLTLKAVAREIEISNLAVLKNPHVSGNFRYDQSIRPDDGQLGLNYCAGMTKWELLRTLYDLGKGHFMGVPKRHSFLVRSVQVAVKQPVPLELDGEIYQGSNFSFSILPNEIYLLGHG